jgi:hypothetical protein
MSFPPSPMAAVTLSRDASLIIRTSWLFWTGARRHATTVRHRLETNENFSFNDVDLEIATTALPSTIRLDSENLWKEKFYLDAILKVDGKSVKRKSLLVDAVLKETKLRHFIMQRCTVVGNPVGSLGLGQILFRGYLGVVRKSRGSPFFRVLLHFYVTNFKTLLSPHPPLAPVCI